MHDNSETVPTPDQPLRGNGPTPDQQAGQPAPQQAPSIGDMPMAEFLLGMTRPLTPEKVLADYQERREQLQESLKAVERIITLLSANEVAMELYLLTHQARLCGRE